MIIRRWALITFAFFGLLTSLRAGAQNETERRQGFYEHHKQNKAVDIEREKGLRDFLKEKAEWEDQRKRDAKADRKRKKLESPEEGSPEYRADRKEKYQDYEQMDSERRGYVKFKRSQEPKNEKERKIRESWALEEYGLDKELPRFDIAKRNLSGTKGGRSSGSGSSGGESGNMSFPPAPPADDFSGSYVPPPPPPDIFDSPTPDMFPPPQPVPFPPPGGDFDNGGFIPPPPPPMPDSGGFDEGF